MGEFITAKYRHVTYYFNPETSYYQKTMQQPESLPVEKLPYELKREITRGAQIIPNAGECLVKNEIKKTNYSKVIFTGLQPTGTHNWYMGDTYHYYRGNKVKSLLIIHFSPDNSGMHIYYFEAYYKDYPEQRLRFTRHFIRHIESQQK
jgi:hypothetical protein